MTRPTAPLRPAVFHILLALAKEDLHGLGIAEATAEASDGAVELGPGTLYRSLKEMLEQKLVVEVESPPGADPRRRYYRATPLGRELIAREVARLDRLLAVARQAGVVPEPT